MKFHGISNINGSTPGFGFRHEERVPHAKLQSHAGDKVMVTQNPRRPCTQRTTSAKGISNKWATLHGEKLKHPKDWHKWMAKHQQGPSHLPLNITEDWDMEYNVAITCDHRKRHNKAASACCMYLWMHVIDWCHKIPASQVYRKSEIKSNWKLNHTIGLSYTVQWKLYRTACW